MSPRIISTDLVIQGKIMTIISVYGPQSGRSKKEKETFFNELSIEYNQEMAIVLLRMILMAMLELLQMDIMKLMVVSDGNNRDEKGCRIIRQFSFGN